MIGWRTGYFTTSIRLHDMFTLSLYMGDIPMNPSKLNWIANISVIISCVFTSQKEINLANLSESLYCLCEHWPSSSIPSFIMKLKVKVGTFQGKSFLDRLTKSHWMVYLAGLNTFYHTFIVFPIICLGSVHHSLVTNFYLFTPHPHKKMK